MISRPLAIAITILVAVVWAASVAVGLLYPDRDVTSINAIFAIVVGAAFGLVPKRPSLASARQRLADRIAGTAAGTEEQPEEDPPADTDPPRGDGP